MKIICEKEKLQKGLSAVVRGVPTRTTMPILEGILIQTNNNELKLTTYDLELGIEYIIDCEVKEEGNTVVNAMMFSEIIRKLPDTEISIEVNENKLLVIECEGSLYKLSTMEPEEFPELPKIEVENSIQTDQTVLKNMIRKTIFAVSIEENRPIFTGCLFEVVNNSLNVVAVDGFRMAWFKQDLENATSDFKAVIPGKTLNEVNKNVLQNCIERISLISSSSIEKEKKYPVKIKIEVGKVTISCTNQTGDAKEEIYTETEGKDLEIGVNPKYFLDALKAVEDEEIFISFGTSISPCVIKPIDETARNYTYMILPIRMKEE